MANATAARAAHTSLEDEHIQRDVLAELKYDARVLRLTVVDNGITIST
jgi:hypothetical protein